MSLWAVLLSGTLVTAQTLTKKLLLFIIVDLLYNNIYKHHC